MIASVDSATLVVDAAVVLKWQLHDEESVSEAIAMRDDFFLRGRFNLVSPSLLTYEVINGVLTAATKLKRLSPDAAKEALKNLLSVGVELREINPERVFELALEYSVTAYDSAYLALAEAEGCELWTGDQKLYKSVKDKLPWVKWIGEYLDTKGEQSWQP